MRKIISEMIAREPGFEVVAIARDGEDGVNKAIEHRPDLITLDIEMPKKDGLQALREIRVKCRDFRPAVLMCSSLTVAGSHETLKALRLGAADFIAKDPAVVGSQDAGFQHELIAKLRALGEHRESIAQPPTADGDTPKAPQQPANWHELIDTDRVTAVAVGSSTGGPPALEEIFARVPRDLRVPIIVAQHMPSVFTRSLAARLDQQCACKVQHAVNGTVLGEPGIFICEGGVHTRPTRVAGGKFIARQSETLAGAVYRPSVDHLFEHAAETWGDGLLAIELTGMGADGAKGAQIVRTRGGQVIAQSGETCVVFGMPKAVIEAGAADAILPPPAIGEIIASLRAESAQGDNGKIHPNFGLRRGA